MTVTNAPVATRFRNVDLRDLLSSSSGVPSKVTRPESRSRQQKVFVALCTAIFSLTIFQRFVVPVGNIPLAQVVVFAVTAYLAILGVLALDWGILTLLSITVSIIFAASLYLLCFSQKVISLQSLLLLLGSYLPFIARMKAYSQPLFERVCAFYCNIITVLAGVAVFQYVSQLAGWKMPDYILQNVPSAFLTQGYNTEYAIKYGSSILKSNGLFFNEPSFCSQFIALAILLNLLLRKRQWTLPLLVAGLLTTVSGTGIVLLGVGFIALTLQRGAKFLIIAAALVVGVVLALNFIPGGSTITDRSGEIGTNGSSGNARFIQPYTQIVEGLSKDTTTVWVGRGAGSVSREGSRFFNPSDFEANYPAVPKLVAEYGVPAALLFTLTMLFILFSRTPSFPLSVAITTMYLFLSASLLQPSTTYIILIFIAFFRKTDNLPAEPTVAAKKRSGLLRTPRLEVR